METKVRALFTFYRLHMIFFLLIRCIENSNYAIVSLVLIIVSITCKYVLVGWQIVAVILCDTGVALLAYMDGITGSPTLSGVVLAASAAAGSAVYKVG